MPTRLRWLDKPPIWRHPCETPISA